jgi:hypothetical protein
MTEDGTLTEMAPAAPTFLPLLAEDGKPQTAAELLELGMAPAMLRPTPAKPK